MVKMTNESHLKFWNDSIDCTNAIDCSEITKAIHKLYDSLKMGEPRVIIAPSPISAALEYCARAPTVKTIKNTPLNVIKKNCIDKLIKDSRISWNAGNGDLSNIMLQDMIHVSLKKPDSIFEKTLKVQSGPIDNIFDNFDEGNLAVTDVYALSFLQKVKNNRMIDFTKFNLLRETIVNGGPRFYHQNFCIVSDFPEIIKRDSERLLHCENGPAIKWRDGWALYYWHGMQIPEEWIINKKSLTAKKALKINNLEKRRVACEIIGWDQILKDLKATIIDTDSNPQIGQLVSVKFPGSWAEDYFLRVTCGTGRTFALPVPSTMKTAIQANAWTYDVPVSVLRNLAART